MNNLKVNYINVPEYIQEQMNEEFCMGKDKDAIDVQFMGFVGIGEESEYYDGFKLKVGNQVVDFDYHSTCYSIISE